jgi:hypothetical protein
MDSKIASGEFTKYLPSTTAIYGCTVKETNSVLDMTLEMCESRSL